MKFLLDECVTSRSLEAFLEEAGHDVLRAAAIDPRASDEHLLALAFHHGRVLVTADKDFGELVFVRNMLHAPVVSRTPPPRNGRPARLAKLGGLLRAAAPR